MNRADKSSSAVTDWTVDWSAELEAGEEIASVQWLVSGQDSSLEIGAGPYGSTHDAKRATCWLLGGTPGGRYVLTCRVTTTSTPARTPNDVEIFITVL